jgi:putative ABC transport system ATP-binding protein
MSPSAPVRLQAGDLVLGFEDRVLVRGLTLEVRAGEIVAVRAPSGRGKTTLLRTLVRLAEPLAGTLTLDGTPLGEIDGRQLRRRIALVAQRPILLGPTVRDDLAAGLGHAPSGPEATALLAEVGLAADMADREVGGCSGGEQARVAIARALATGPDLLLLDEPSAALDEAATRDLAAALRTRASAGLGIVLITHDPLLLAETAARQVELPWVEAEAP